MTEKGRAREAGPVKDPTTGKWGFVIDLGVGGDGKRKQARRRGFNTKKEATEALTALRGAVQTETYVAPAKQTVTAFFDEWLATIKREPSTISSYRRNVRLHVSPHIGGVQLQKLDAARLNRLYGLLGEHLSARTVRYIATIIHGALKDAVKWGRILRNVADAAEPPRASDARPPEMKTWTGDETDLFLSLVEGSRYRIAWLAIVTTGMRRGECLGLRWKDIDLDGARLSIRQTITSVEHKIVVANRTKTGSARPIDLDKTNTVAELRAHRVTQAQELLRLGIRQDGDTLVFCHPDGRPYDPERFSREFTRALDRHPELPRIRVHDLRHTHATLAMEAGVPVKVISERLGHSKSSTTQDLYQHVTPTMQIDAAERIAGLIFGSRR